MSENKRMTKEEVKNAAKALGQTLNKDNIEQRTEFEKTIKELEAANLNESDFAVIGSLLALPDEQFDVLAPLFLEELQKSYNDTNIQALMVQTMNMKGMKSEDIEQEYLAICEAIDFQVKDSLSAPKRDFLKQMLGITYNSVAGMEGIAKKTINIPIEYCRPDAKMPAYAHPSDAGMDVFATEEITINPGETKLIPLGIKVAIPLGYELQVRPKSGRCLKTKLRVANTPGTIDAGYRDEVGVIVENIDPPIRAIHTDFANSPNDPIPVGAIDFGQSYTIGKGEKFAQLVLSEVPKVCWIEVEKVGAFGENRGGGFGSTGVK